MACEMFPIASSEMAQRFEGVVCAPPFAGDGCRGAGRGDEDDTAGRDDANFLTFGELTAWASSEDESIGAVWPCKVATNVFNLRFSSFSSLDSF